MRHIHHVLWWSLSGPTDIDMLAGVCKFDHHRIHHGKLKVESVGPHQFRFSVPDRPAFTPTAPTPAISSIEELNEQAGLVIDDRTCASHEENAPYDFRYAVDVLAARVEQLANANAKDAESDAAEPTEPPESAA